MLRKITNKINQDFQFEEDEVDILFPISPTNYN